MRFVLIGKKIIDNGKKICNIYYEKCETMKQRMVSVFPVLCIIAIIQF